MINGVVYNRNEAGNFMWSYYLLDHGFPLHMHDVLAQGGSLWFYHRFDEPHDTAARNAGADFYLKIHAISENYGLNRIITW